jgi:hypothetical protein
MNILWKEHIFVQRKINTEYIQHIHTIYSFEIIEKNLQIQCTNNFTILQCKAGTDPTFFFYLFHINFLAILW